MSNRQSREDTRKLRIVLSTWGSTGDVQPFLALSDRLLKEGHKVRVCTSEIYRDQFAKRGIDFCAVGAPFDLDRLDQAMDRIVQIKDPLKSAILIAKEGILYKADQWYEDCLKGMEGYDLAICHSADVPGQEAAIRNNLPWITASYCPGFIKTCYEAPSPIPNLGAPLNTLLWKVAEQLIRKQVDPLFNDFITSIGGEERECIGLKGMYSPELNLIAASPSVSKPAPDLPSEHKFTGAWFLEETDCEVPLALQEFLDQGSPPVIISFGSMGGSKNVETTNILVEAVQRADQRAIIQAGWGNLGLDSPPENICFVGYVPHNFLFRQGCCVIHHGGAGTTAAACRAGVPSITVPHLADQPYWGYTLHKIGVAPKPLHRQDMTPKRLAKRISQVVSSQSMADKARELMEKIEMEDGLITAVHIMIEKILVFSLSFIGDAVLSTAVISPLRQRFPNAKITFLVGVRAFDLLAADPQIDQVLVYDNRGEHAGWRGKIRLIKLLRREGFDLVVDLRDSLWSRFVGEKHWGMQLRRGNIHAVTRYLDVLQRHGLDVDGARPQLQFAPSRLAKRDAFLTESGVSPHQVLVGIHPGGNWVYKLWNPESFAQIADRLRENWNAQILLFAGPSERELQAQVASLMHQQPICVQEDDLCQVAALIAACDFYIGNDTGPMHIAVAVGTPVIGIFGSTNHHRNGPYGEEHIVVHSGVELGCNPCHPGKRPGGCGKGSCAVIEAVTVEQAFNAAEKLKHVKRDWLQETGKSL